MAEVHKFQFEGNQLAYQKLGEGPAILLAFHGFGQDNQVFASLAASLNNQFTIFAIDLFFHGNSQYAGRKLLTKPDWNRFIAAFLRAQSVTRFSVMGFSLGGRFALAISEEFANQLDQLLLIAPDGITNNVWYRLATASSLGRTLFRYVLRHLSILKRFGQGLVWLGWLNRALMRFAELSLGTDKQRELAYLSWTQFRQIRPDLTTLAAALNANSVRVRFFMGAFDRIVPGFYVLPLTKRLWQYELTNLPTRHNQLIDLAGSILASAE